MEKEFDINKSLADHGGISVMLASVQSFIDEVTTQIHGNDITIFPCPRVCFVLVLKDMEPCG
jgi:hypothetical protein